MAFERVAKPYRSVSPRVETERLRLGVHRNESGRVVYISLSRLLIDKVGWTSITSGTRDYIDIKVHEGVGEDAGFLLLEESDTETADLRIGSTPNKRQAFVAVMRHERLKHYLLNDDEVPIAEVEYDINKDKTILVQCPDWLRYNPQSYKEPEKPKVEERKPAPRPPLELVPPRGKDKHRRRA